MGLEVRPPIWRSNLFFYENIESLGVGHSIRCPTPFLFKIKQKIIIILTFSKKCAKNTGLLLAYNRQPCKSGGNGKPLQADVDDTLPSSLKTGG
jgi:hypothetical protein